MEAELSATKYYPTALNTTLQKDQADEQNVKQRIT